MPPRRTRIKDEAHQRYLDDLGRRTLRVVLDHNHARRAEMRRRPHVIGANAYMIAARHLHRMTNEAENEVINWRVEQLDEDDRPDDTEADIAERANFTDQRIIMGGNDTDIVMDMDFTTWPDPDIAVPEAYPGLRAELEDTRLIGRTMRFASQWDQAMHALWEDEGWVVMPPDHGT